MPMLRKTLRPAMALLATVALAACASAPAYDLGQVAFAPMAGQVGAEAATVRGAMNQAAPYTILVRLAPGGSIAPHTHPDARELTIVSGEVLYGFGETADRASARLYRKGQRFTVPANAPHYAFATDAASAYQETGVGPSAFTPVRRPSPAPSAP